MSRWIMQLTALAGVGMVSMVLMMPHQTAPEPLSGPLTYEVVQEVSQNFLKPYNSVTVSAIIGKSDYGQAIVEADGTKILLSFLKDRTGWHLEAWDYLEGSVGAPHH